jgi:hypothetical protein
MPSSPTAKRTMKKSATRAKECVNEFISVGGDVSDGSRWSCGWPAKMADQND